VRVWSTASLVTTFNPRITTTAEREAQPREDATLARRFLPIHRRGSQVRSATMSERVDGTGAAYAGSQMQTQLYVNVRTAQLDDVIRAEFPSLAGARLEWRSPLADDGFREYWDRAFLERVDLDRHAVELRSFWPTGGPHWDTLAVGHQPGDKRPGVLLVEGKSYPEEFFGSRVPGRSGLAVADADRELARWTQQQLGVAGRSPADWCGRLYQSANRLAHLCWLRSLGVRACLAHLLFVDDPHRPTTVDEWAQAVRAVNAELGLESAALDGAGHVLLQAAPRSDLVPKP
jgi:hypothetical protein